MTMPGSYPPVTEQDLLLLHLNELSAARAREVRGAIARDPALLAESSAVASALAAVAAPDVPMPLPGYVVERNWQRLRGSLAPHASPASAGWTGGWRPWLAGGLVAAVLAGGVVFSRSRQVLPGAARPGERADETPAGEARQVPVRPGEEGHAGERASGNAREPGFRGSFVSGVYRPAMRASEGPVHPIGLANSPEAAEPLPARRRGEESVFSAVIPAAEKPWGEALPPVFAESLPRVPVVSVTAGRAGSEASGARRGDHPRHTTDVMLGVGGTLIPEHSSLTAGTEPRTLRTTHSIVAIGSFHQQFSPALGYRITASYTRPEFSYTYSSGGTGSGGFFQSGAINSRIFEAAGTYVRQGPRRKRLTTSVDAGLGLMAFVPTNLSDPSTSYSYRMPIVLGANADLALTAHLGARLGYRAQLVRTPDFRYSGGTIPVTASLVVDHEPSLGITYTFGKR